MLNYEQIKSLIKEIDASSLRTLELENKGFKLKLSKNNKIIKDNINHILNNTIEDDFKDENQILINNENINNIEINDKDVSGNIVKSPLVGTYYSASSPEADPYVRKGDYVKKGDTLCIIEAMKIMNEITSDFEGKVVKVLRNDEDIVEYGMDLFVIK